MDQTIWKNDITFPRDRLRAGSGFLVASTSTLSGISDFTLGSSRPTSTRARQTAAKKAVRREAKRRVEEQWVGIAWYLPKHWDKLREISADKDSLEHTYAEWLVNAESAQAQTGAAGVSIERVIVDVDELEAWCRSRGWLIDGKSRSRFVAHLLRRVEEQKEFEKDDKLEGDNPSPAQETAPGKEEMRNLPSH